jgi:hypothetical protein
LTRRGGETTKRLHAGGIATISKSIVKSRIALANPAPLMRGVQAELAAVRAAGDADFATSDIPPLTDNFWQNAMANPFTGRGRHR